VLRFMVTGRSGGANVLQLPLHWHRLPIVTRPLVGHAHRAGLSVHVWELNDARSIERALDRGVDGVMTDRPELLKRVLAERGLWH
jgi:glycerophosphoryl diester phosphodiesterase